MDGTHHTDLSQLPPLHPDRVNAALKLTRSGGTPLERDLAEETARKALEVVKKLQTGFGFAPDLYDKVDQARTFGQHAGEIFKQVRKMLGQK